MAAIFDPFGNAVHTALTFPMLGEDVLVTGAGPIGIMAAMVSRHAGARHVVITDLSAERLALARTLGVSRAVQRRPASGWPTRSASSDMHEGFDVGLEMSGSPAALRDMISQMTHGGRIAMLGLPAEEISIDFATVVLNMLTIKGDLRPGDVRDLVRDVGAAGERPGHLRGDHRPLPLHRLRSGLRRRPVGARRQGDHDLGRMRTMYAALKDQLADDLATLKAEGLYKAEAVITTPQAAEIGVGDALACSTCAPTTTSAWPTIRR